MNTAMFRILMLAANAPAAEEGVVNPMFSLILSFIFMGGAIYLFMIRPQNKKEKEAKKLRESLQIGDEVTTIGGIVGIIVRKNEDTGTVVIETGGDRSKIRVKLWAISENLTVHDEQEEMVSKK